MKLKLLALLLLTLILSLSATAEQQKTTDPLTWEKTQQGVTFYLKQLHPDQVKAFYLGRGFSQAQIKPYTDSCVYTSILRNDHAVGRIHFLRKNWRINSKDKQQSIQQNSAWLALFKQQNVSPSALIAFRLAQLPEEQEYEPSGDWNQGMLAIDLPLGSQFDLTVNWDINGQPYAMKLKGLRCAKQKND